MFVREAEGGREGGMLKLDARWGGGVLLADFSFVSLFIQICFHPLADRTNMQQHTVESEHTATVSQICGEAFKRPIFYFIFFFYLYFFFFNFWRLFPQKSKSGTNIKTNKQTNKKKHAAGK